VRELLDLKIYITLDENSTQYIPVTTKHSIKNILNSDLVFIEIQTGTSFDEDDIIRFEDAYGRI